MSSLESGIEKTIKKGRRKSEDENLAGFELALKLKNAIKAAKAKMDPNYKGDNPKKIKDVIKDLSAMGKVSKSKGSEARKAEGTKKVEDSKKKKTEKKAELEVAGNEGAGQEQVTKGEGQQIIEAVMEQQSREQAPEVFVTTGIKTEGQAETKKRTAIDEQIAFMKLRLKDIESYSKIFDKKSNPEQKAEREKLIEELKSGIIKAERAKARLEATEEERKKVANQARVKQDKLSVKVNPPKQALDGQINQIQKSSSTSKESVDQYAENLVKGVFGDDVFERENVVSEVAPISVDIPIEQVLTGEKKQDDQQDKKAKQEIRKKGGATTKKEKPKSNNGAKVDSGLMLDEEAEQRLRVQRRMARAREATFGKQESVVLSKPSEVNPVVEPKVEMPAAEPQAEVSRQAEAKQEAEQLNLKLEIPLVEKWGVSEEKLKEEQRGEKLFDKIHRLNEEVAEARTKYVQEDYENTKTWKKLFSMFRIKEDVEKGEWRAEYETKTLELQKAELEMVEAGEKDRQRDTRKEMSGLLRYYKLNERMDLINERTQYRAKNLTFGEKLGDSIGSFGRWYNGISFKNKMIIAGALGGAALAAPVVGGALGATVYAAMAARRWLAGAGLAVSAEAGLEKLGEKRRAKQTGEEIEQQMSNLTGTTNEAFYNLEEILKKDVLSLDSKLQHEKRAKTYRKLAATTLGVAVGSGWLSQIIMDKLGGKEALEWAKESLGFGESVPEDLSLPSSPITAEVAAGTTARAAAEVQDNFINQFVNQDIVVEKGDSVWKISERLADQFNFDDTQRTHFIDAMKDKFGDVQLQAGEHINFSEHGIDEDFVKHTFEDSNAISPEQSAQILENNTRLSAFAEANPNVRLTDELTKNILEGKTPKVSDLRSFPPPASVVDLHEGAQAHTASEFRFGPQVDIEHQPVPEGASPEDIASEYGVRADGWYDQIFKVENVQFGDRVLGRDIIESLKLRDVIRDGQLFKQGAADGYITGLSQQEISNFLKFDENVSKSHVIFDRLAFWRGNPNATVLDYLKKIASLTRQGQRIGPYTSL